MLTIRPEQLAIFRSSGRGAFCTRMLLHLRETFGDMVKRETDAKLLLWIELTTHELEEFGIDLETDVELYLELAVCHPREMLRKPLPKWVTDVLGHPGRTPSQRVEILREDLLFGRSQDDSTSK